MITNSTVKTPLATLRGHNVGVTAIAQCLIDGNSYLLSGDEEGSLVVWDLSIFRKIFSFPKLIISRTQCLKVIILPVSSIESAILIAQSRNDGIQLFNLTECLRKSSTLKPLATYQTYSALFSKCDATNMDKSSAVLVYPSTIENNLITIRIIEADMKTLLSGTAKRFNDEAQKKCVVFDLRVCKGLDGQYLLFAAYEDGHLCLFSFSPESTETIPVLNSTGLKVDFVKDFDLGLNDFLSAFDVISNPEMTNFLAICGSPLKQLTFLSYRPNDPNEIISNDVALKKKGVSTICMRPDRKLAAVACWNAEIRLYSLKSQKLLAILDHHKKQVQSILFIEKQDTHCYLDGISGDEFAPSEKKYLLCCASKEGTISISAIY